MPDEWRLRAGMGADTPLDDRAVSVDEREQFKRRRAELSAEFARLSPEEKSYAPANTCRSSLRSA